MKKIYTSPAIEIENIEVEQGIAMSVISDSFSIQGYTFDDENDYSGMWQ